MHTRGCTHSHACTRSRGSEPLRRGWRQAVTPPRFTPCGSRGKPPSTSPPRSPVPAWGTPRLGLRRPPTTLPSPGTAPGTWQEPSVGQATRSRICPGRVSPREKNAGKGARGAGCAGVRRGPSAGSPAALRLGRGAAGAPRGQKGHVVLPRTSLCDAVRGFARGRVSGGAGARSRQPSRSWGLAPGSHMLPCRHRLV